MTPEVAAKLREKFAPEKISKKPKLSCRNCSDAKTKVCTDHTKAKCPECGNWISTAHLHLDYAGHADVTDRLLECDPDWNWEPFAVGPDGLPVVDRLGGMWIRLTVAGTTRIGYGDAEGKQGPNAVKEVIGDAIRNAALRFGVGLDLWRKEKPAEESDQPVTRPRARKAQGGTRSDVATAPDPEQSNYPQPGPQEPGQRKKVFGLWGDLGYGGEEKREERLAITSKIIGHEVTSTAALDYNQMSTLIQALQKRLRETGGVS